MKFLNLTLLVLSLAIVFSCTESDQVNDDIGCDNNYAQYAYNDSLITTSFMANESDVLTPEGVNCGTGAVIDLSANRLTLRIHTEGHSVSIGVLIGDLNELQEIQSVTYTDKTIDLPFALAEDFIRMFTISEMDTTNKTIMGTFNFVVKNSNGTSMISNGEFKCDYQEF